MHAQTIGQEAWKNEGTAKQFVPFESVFAPFNAIAEAIIFGAETVARAASAFIQAERREYKVRRAIRELSALDDRTLNDIGINRGNIPYVARYGREHRAQEGSS